jgi:transposase
VKTCQRTMTAIENDWAALEIAIDELVSGDEKLKRLKQIIMSVPGVGRVTALQIIICTNEFKNINNPRKFACYAGVAPFKTESGIGTDLVRARISHIANKKMKSLLHICALVAIRWDEQIKNYYERKTVTEKKPKMSAINAVRNKLVSIIFACVKKDQLYLPGYISSWCECKSQTAGNGQIMPGETLTETVLACQSD